MKNANSQSYDPFSVIEGPARGDAEFTKNLWSARTSQQKPYLTTVPDEAAQADIYRRPNSERCNTGMSGQPANSGRALEKLMLPRASSECDVERANAVLLRGFGLGRHGHLHCDCLSRGKSVPGDAVADDGQTIGIGVGKRRPRGRNGPRGRHSLCGRSAHQRDCVAMANKFRQLQVVPEPQREHVAGATENDRFPHPWSKPSWAMTR